MISPIPAIVVMGVSGSGKSLLGWLLADRCGWPFIEGDDYHSPQNLRKLAQAIPLNDDDRREWLDIIADRMAGAPSDRPVVVSCSALKRRYRDRLRQIARPVVFVHLIADEEVLKRRLDGRERHFMPAALLQSQLEDLEPPDADETAVTLDADQPPESLLDAAITALCPYIDGHGSR